MLQRYVAPRFVFFLVLCDMRCPHLLTTPEIVDCSAVLAFTPSKLFELPLVLYELGKSVWYCSITDQKHEPLRLTVSLLHGVAAVAVAGVRARASRGEAGRLPAARPRADQPRRW